MSPPESAIDRGALCGDQLGEGRGHVGDDLHGSEHRGDDTGMERETVAIYEARAREWRDARPARFRERAVALGAAVPAGVPRLDAGAGPGLHLDALGRPVVALDAAFAMLELAREAAPHAGCIQGDLEHLPFARGSVGGTWARASYLHIARARLPWALMELHQACAVDAPIALAMRPGAGEGPLADDDFAGRVFVEWEPSALSDVLVGAGFDGRRVRDRPGGSPMDPRPGDAGHARCRTSSAPTCACCCAG